MPFKKVMIIEDEPVIALDFEKMIEEMGFISAGKYRHGVKALDTINNSKPDLILLDINLRDGISGYEIADILIKENVPFIVITGSADESSLKKISELRASGVLIKPVYKAEFTNAVKNVLSSSDS
jgi:CheY-like chemotaxis protein